MRIVAGEYGGRRLQVPKDNLIRPTSDKVRGAIFNALQAQGAVDGARVLDGFCGTGALGLEALSRGADHCTFIDKSKVSLGLAKANAESLGALGQSAFLLKDLGGSFLLEKTAEFDLVFLDAPYRKNLISDCLQRLGEIGCLAQDCDIVVEAEKDFAPILEGSFAVQSMKTYGDTAIFYMRYAL